MTKNDGGPAFPSSGRLCYDDRGKPRWHDGKHIIMDGGLTIRDWFAGQALVGFVNAHLVDAPEGTEYDDAAIAEQVYALADAMIAERDK